MTPIDFPARRGNSRISARLTVALLATMMLAGCESGARQDPLLVRGGTAAATMPMSTALAAHVAPAGPKSGDGGAPDSPIAYQQPALPTYPDRPLSENLGSALEVADYVRGLQITGRLALLRRAGPFTVFAIPNQPYERYMANWPRGARPDQPDTPELRRLIDATIIRGDWTDARLRRAIARGQGTAIALRTLGGDPLTVSLEPATHQLVLVNSRGQTNRLWLVSAPQSNGVLYFTQGVLPPG